jgi:hypothetical protein
MRIQGEAEGAGDQRLGDDDRDRVAQRAWGRRRGESAPAGLSSCAPRRTAWSPAICARRRQTALTASLPSRADRPTIGRPRWWKLTTGVLRPLLPSLGCLLTRCQCRGALRGRASFLRHAHRCASRHRVDRMLATDRTASRRCSHSRECRRHVQSHRRPRATPPTTHGIPREAPRSSAPAASTERINGCKREPSFFTPHG